jgi:catechol 2,3-dioxygenase-like lactoylglutathione lyase family enzyme
MLDHMTFRVCDLAAARKFYEAALLDSTAFVRA